MGVCNKKTIRRDRQGVVDAIGELRLVLEKLEGLCSNVEFNLVSMCACVRTLVRGSVSRDL